MLYDPIFSKSFSRYEQKRIGRYAFFGCVIIAFSICTVFKPQFHVQIVSSVNMQLSRSAGAEGGMAVLKDKVISEPEQRLTRDMEDNIIYTNKIISKSLKNSSGNGVDDKQVASNAITSKPLHLSTADTQVNRESTVLKDKTVSKSLQYLSSTSDGVKERTVAKGTITSEAMQSSDQPLELSNNDGVRDQEAATYILTSKALQSSMNNSVTDRKIAKDPFVSESSSSPVSPDTYIAIDATGAKPMQLSTGSGLKEDLVFNDTHVIEPTEVQAKRIMPVCIFSEHRSDYCDIQGDIRVHPYSSTIFVVFDQQSDISYSNGASWVIKPYARKGNKGAMESVKSWTIKVMPSHQNSPSCTKVQNIPAILFSLAGYSGNHFHDFADIIIPLFLTSRKFDAEVHYLATNYKSWWGSKFRRILEKLSAHRVIDIDKEEGTLCYKSLIIGLKTRKELGIDPTSYFNEGLSMNDFRYFLRSAYSLKRETVIKWRKGTTLKPRLMIISRKKSRTLMNERRVTTMAQSMGYEVIVADATLSTDLSYYAELVNSCDVLMGVHGAGLTNMVFLPDNAVMIQIVPLGIDGFARNDFEVPAVDMKIRYLGYKIKVKESSLIQQYSVNSATIRDPLSVHKNRWDVIRSVYLDKQDVKLDLHRFRSTLLKAQKLLQQ